jgi:hypothetical protein
VGSSGRRFFSEGGVGGEKEPNDERLGRTLDWPKAEGAHLRFRGCCRGWIVGAVTRSATTG